MKTNAILKVDLENFRLFDKLELDFTNAKDEPLKLVVFVGPNGCGKTSILEACILGLGYTPADWDEFKPERFISSGKDDYLITIEYLITSIVDSTHRMHRLTFKHGKRPIPVRYSYGQFTAPAEFKKRIAENAKNIVHFPAHRNVKLF